MKTTKYVILFLSILFVGIVAIEQVPGVMVPLTDAAGETEYLMFGLFKISLLDDITHLVSGLVGFYVLFRSYALRVRYLMVFGGYYTLDAVFFILFGLVSGQSLLDNFLLNGPHIGISVLAFYALSKSVKQIELK